MPVLTRERLARAQFAASTAAARGRRLRHALGFPGALAVLVIVLGELLVSGLDAMLNTGRERTLSIATVGCVMLVIAWRWSGRLAGDVAGDAYGCPGTQKLPGRRGLVVLVGLDSAEPDSPAVSLFSMCPAVDYVAFVGTPETAQLGVVDTLVDKVLPAVGVTLDKSRTRRWEFGHAESVSAAEESVAEALRWMLGRGLDASEVVVDVSAGRRAMAYGAKDAADEHLVETHYLAAAWDTVANRPIAGTSSFKVIKAFHP